MSPRIARIALAVYLLAIYSTLGYVRTITNALRDRGVLQVSVAVAFIAAAACFLWLVFRDRNRRSLRVVLTLIAIAAVYVAVIWPMESPEEKIHFIQYGVVALLAYASTGRYIVSAVFVAAAGWIDEGIQALLPSRYYDLRDVAFNAAAGLLALIALALLKYSSARVGAGRHQKVA